MKLAKKVLVCVVALALMSTVAFTALAAGTSLSVSAPATANVGDTIEVSGVVNGAKGLESAAFVLEWDPAVLEYVNQSSSIEGASAQGGKIAENQASVAIAYNESATVDTITALTVTFKVIATGDAKLSLAVLDGDFSGIDGVDPDALAAGAATVKASEKPAEPEKPSASEKPSDDNKAPAENVTKDNSKASDNKSTSTPSKSIPKTGDAGVAVAAALVVLAGAAFVASKKTK